MTGWARVAIRYRRFDARGWSMSGGNRTRTSAELRGSKSIDSALVRVQNLRYRIPLS